MTHWTGWWIFFGETLLWSWLFFELLKKERQRDRRKICVRERICFLWRTWGGLNACRSCILNVLLFLPFVIGDIQRGSDSRCCFVPLRSVIASPSLILLGLFFISSSQTMRFFDRVNFYCASFSNLYNLIAANFEFINLVQRCHMKLTDF